MRRDCSLVPTSETVSPTNDQPSNCAIKVAMTAKVSIRSIVKILVGVHVGSKFLI